MIRTGSKDRAFNQIKITCAIKSATPLLMPSQAPNVSCVKGGSDPADSCVGFTGLHQYISSFSETAVGEGRR